MTSCWSVLKLKLAYYARNSKATRTLNMKKIVYLLFLVLLGSITSYAVPEETGAWSEAVNGLRGRLIAKEDMFRKKKCSGHLTWESG